MRFAQIMFKIPRILTQIAKKIKMQNGSAILVGGSVRDMFLGLPLTDYDIEIYGITQFKDLKKVLSEFGACNEVGKAFSVLKLKTKNLEIDFSFPRRDFKFAKGHKGFKTEADPNLDYTTAASRRDFTINSMGVNLLTKEFLDPFQGKQDLEKKILRHIGPAFSEDPLRVYRACQFASRFNLKIHPTTIKLCQKINTAELPKERIFEELTKLLLKSKTPSIGLNYLADLNLLKEFPQLSQLYQNKALWKQTLGRVDEIAKLIKPVQENALSLMLAALCINFDQVAPLFLKQITNNKKLIQTVTHVAQKTQLILKNQKKISDSNLRKIALKGFLDEIILCVKASESPIEKWLKQKQKSLQLDQAHLTPILKGEHLLALRIKPGPKMGQILKKAFNMQLEGKITTLEEGLKWIKNWLIID